MCNMWHKACITFAWFYELGKSTKYYVNVPNVSLTRTKLINEIYIVQYSICKYTARVTLVNDLIWFVCMRSTRSKCMRLTWKWLNFKSKRAQIGRSEIAKINSTCASVLCTLSHTSNGTIHDKIHFNILQNCTFGIDAWRIFVQCHNTLRAVCEVSI